ncbi:golgin subfamily B member 1-like [Solea solea]|uniref:golgin subfamily B member 1-like n=1 Tax=Solea solea TaxID=90069 RepID=UPI00272A1D12|nr:golgin subfamily B member 1-like [Solea solea]
MDTELLLDRRDEQAGLKREVCRLQEELAESRAEREELDSRNRALNDRLCQSVCPSVGLSLHVEAEQREWRRRVREGREREARQSLLIHRLQNKVVEYRERCQRLELQLQDENTQLIITEQRIRGECSDSLESALIRLEEEQQRSVGLVETNTFLREQLIQSDQSNQVLGEELQKLKSDWLKCVEEVKHRESDWLREKESGSDVVGQHQTQLWSLWRSVVSLQTHCHSVKTAADRDLLQLRAEFSRFSSSLLSSCVSVSSSLRLSTTAAPPPPPLSSTLLLPPPNSASSEHPLASSSYSSTLGTFCVDDLESRREVQEVSQLKEQMVELSLSLQEERGRGEEREREVERHREAERKLRSVLGAVIRLSRVLSSCGHSVSVSSDSVLSLDLSSLLSILSQSESVLQRRHEELQGAELSVRRLSEEKAGLQLQLKQLEDDMQQLHTHTQHTQQALTHTVDTLSREREAASSLRLQVDEVKRENDRLRRERGRQEDRERQLETETHRRVETELLENVQLTERDVLHRLEIHSLKVALEREQLDRQRAEEEAADARNALQKSRECVLRLSSTECALKRELDEGRDSLHKMTALNSALASDKREVNKQLLQLECELSNSQSQLQALRSEVTSLQTKVKTLGADCDQLRAQREVEVREREREMERVMEEKEKELTSVLEERESAARRQEQLLSQCAAAREELQEVRRRQQQEEEQKEIMRLQEEEEEKKKTRRQEVEEEQKNSWRQEVQQLEEVRRGERRQQEEEEEEEEELHQLRSVSVSLHHQLSQQQRQLSQTEVDRCQLTTHIHTLQQAKLTLQGEIECLKEEVEQVTTRKERSEAEREVLKEKMERLTAEVEELRTTRREEEEEREAWQKEREALNEELGMRDGEVEVLRRRKEGLTEEKEERQREVQRLRVELTEKEVHMMERFKHLVGEKEKLEEEVKRAELGLREEKVKMEERREEERQRDREMEALCDRMERLEKEKEEVEKEFNRLTNNISQLEEEREEVERLRSAARTAAEEVGRWRARVEEVEREKEEQRRQKERLQDEKQEVVGQMEAMKKEKVQEVELLMVRLSVAQEQCEEIKEEVQQKECSLEHQMSAVREREQEVQELKECLRLVEEQEVDGTREVQEVRAKLKQTEEREEQLEELLRETSALLEKERSEGGDKDENISLLTRELQEAQAESDEVKRRAQQNEEDNNRLKEEVKEWQENVELSKREGTKLSRLLKEREEEVQQLKDLLEREEEKRQEAEELRRMEEDRKKRLDVKVMEVKEQNGRLEEKVREVQEELEEEREVLWRTKEEKRRLENKLKVLEEKRKREEEELSGVMEEKSRMESELRQKVKEMEAQKEVLRSKEEEERKLEDELRKAKEEREELVITQREQHLLGEERGRAREREQEEEKVGLLVELRRRRQEGKSLREQLQRERDEVQEEQRKSRDEVTKENTAKEEIQEKLRTTEKEVTNLKQEIQKAQSRREEVKMEVSALREEVQEEQREKKEVQEQLEKIKEKVTVITEEVHKERREKEQMQEERGRREEIQMEMKMEVSALREEVHKERREKKEVQEQLLRTKEEVLVITDKYRREKELLQEELVKMKVELRREEHSEKVKEEQLNFLQSQVLRLSGSRDGAQVQEKQQMKQGLRAALEEMTNLKVLLQESHAEGERLRSILMEKKEEVERVRGENHRSSREEVLRQRGEVEELRARVTVLERRKQEVLGELEEAQQKKEKAEQERREAEEQWRSRVEKMEEQDVKLRALLGENLTLKEELEETQMEVKEIRATAAMLEEQKTQMFSVQEENEELSRQVYALTQRTEELEGDRNRVRLALERTEATIVGYEGRTNQWERSTGAESNPDLQHVSDRLTSLHHHVAELELEKTQQSKKISHLENQREKLKRERKTLRDTLREVEQQRVQLRQQMIDSSRSQVLTDSTEEEHLRRRVMELEDQVSQLRLLLAADQQQRAEFIEQSTRNSEWLLSLRHELRDSLAVVTHGPIPSVLESEAERLDRSLREEELRMTLSQYSALSLSLSVGRSLSLSLSLSQSWLQWQQHRLSSTETLSDEAVTWTQLDLQDCSHKQQQETLTSMTAGDPEDTGTCERRTGGQRGEGEDNMKCPLSFTTISTIAIQAGQSQLVVSVLQSGSLVHLQLVQVQPGLCEVGSDQEENQTLIQELQQLKDKLEKHEREVLAVVENGRQTEQRRRKEEQQQETEVHKAMEASVSEGWSLLLRLLHRRQEVLLLASDFYCRALEFVVSMDRAEKLHISTDSHRLTCATMRRGLLDNSLTVLNSSSVLLQKLRLLQRAEALHRRGTVLQDDDWECEHQSSQGSWGPVLKLEELLETLQDRRRTVDQALRLKLQQLENQVRKKDHKSRPEVWTPILDQNLPPESTSFKSADLQSDSKTEKPRDLESGSRADVRPGPIVEKTTVKNHVKSGSRSQQTRIRNPEFRTEENKDLNPESRTDVPSGLKAELQPKSGSRLENFRNLQSRFRLDVNSDSKLLQTCDGQSESISGLRPGSRSQETSYVQPESSSDMKSKSRSQESRNMQTESRLDQKPTSWKGKDLQSESSLEESLELHLGSESDTDPESKSDLDETSPSRSISTLMPGSRPHDTSYLQPESTSDMKSESRSGESTNMQTESRLDQKPTSHLQSESSLQESLELHLGYESDTDPESKSDMKPGSFSKKSIDQQPGSTSERIRKLQSRFKLNQTAESTTSPPRSISALMPGSRPHETSYLQPESTSDMTSESRSGESTNMHAESRLDQIPTSEKNKDLQSESRSQTKEIHVQPGSRSERIRKLQSRFRLNQTAGLMPGFRPHETSYPQPESTSDMKSDSGTEQSRNMEPETRLEQMTRLRTQQTTDVESGSRPQQTRCLESGSSSDLIPRSISEKNKDQESESSSEEIVEIHFCGDPPESRSDTKPGSVSGKIRNLLSGSRSDLQTSEESSPRSEGTMELQFKSKLAERKDLASETNLKPESGSDRTTRLQVQKTFDEGNHVHNVLPANQQQLLSSCELLMDKVCSWVQQSRSVLSNCSDAGRRLCEAEDALNTHMKLCTQAESAHHDIESLKQILDQIGALPTDVSCRTGPCPHSEVSRPLSVLKTLTQQLKRGGTAEPAAASTGSLSPELAARVDVVLKELQSLNLKIKSNLQLLQPYVSFLRTVQQVEEQMEELRGSSRRRSGEEEENIESANSSWPPLKKEEEQEEKEQVDICWQDMLQKLLTTQELGKNYVQTIVMVLGSGLDLQSLVSVVQQTIEKLSRTEQEVKELWSQQRVQIHQHQEDMKSYRRFQDRLLKVSGVERKKNLQDLSCVSELLDSCTSVDLDSDVQTSRLLERFKLARPHFTQLDTEVADMKKSWKTVRGVQQHLQVKEVKEEVEDLSELLKLHEKVKRKVEQSELILDLTSSFHLTVQQLEALLQSQPPAELSGVREERQPIQSLFEKLSTLKTHICAAAAADTVSGFSVEQLQRRLLSLESLCASWLNKAVRHEEMLRLLNDDIIQLRDSFKELKKKFSNLKFNYLKRNDRGRNLKAVRNQRQQVEMYEDKLQVLRKQLQGVIARLGSEVKEGGVAWETEDAVNQLERQMVEFERSMRGHQKTLDMSCKLQEAMEEYQFWCEDASATIARVGKFSCECRSTDAVAVLHRQFEKFVWPTVPQQEERIVQITELAVRLHGVEEGRRFTEKTVSKHSEMMASIKELSDDLMQLEVKLKLQKDAEKEVKEETQEKEVKEETQEKDGEKENKMKENRKKKKEEEVENISSQEAVDMQELKETGHTPELTTEHDGREVPVKRETAANRKPPFQKSHSREFDRETLVSENRQHSERFTSSYSSSQTRSFSCSPVETNQLVSSDVQRQNQGKETGTQVAPGGDLLEAELLLQEVMSEDLFFTDEYECPSPDDISLPPLAETPESGMVQSDTEEGFCFQSNQQNHVQSGQSGSGSAAGAVQQHRESCLTEGCPTPPVTLHCNTRFRSESISFVQSPLTVPAPSFLSSSLRTEETTVNKFSDTADQSLTTAEPDPGHKDNATDSSSNKDNVFPETEPQVIPGNQGKNTIKVLIKNETLPQADSVPHPAALSQIHIPPKSTYGQVQTLNDVQVDKAPSQSHRFLKCGTNSTETATFCQDKRLTQIFPGTKLHSPVTQQTFKVQTSPSDTFSSSHVSHLKRPLSQSKTFLKTDQIPQTRGFAPSLTDSASHKVGSLLQDSGLLESLKTSTILTQDSQSYTDCRSGLDQREPSSWTSNETPTVDLPQSTTTTPSVVYCRCSPSENIPQSCTSSRSKQDSSSSCGSNVQASHPTDPSSIRSTRSQQIHPTLHSHHEPVTSTCTQQCVHDPGMTPSSPAKPTAHTKALAQQAIPHVTTPSSPSHLLTSDPDICLPLSIREEIRLTPQIQGPPLPAPPLPQGKASKAGPSCFTRPLSRATVMEGSPVTLEVEVTRHPEPTLTWCKDGGVAVTSSGGALVCEDGKHFLFLAEASHSEGGASEKRAAAHGDSSGDRWLLSEVFDVMSKDWLTWFGSLCVLLWLLVLVLL